MPSIRSDKDIRALIIDDPDKGFRQLLDFYKEPVYWHIRRLTVSHQDAEDALQETFVRVFRNLDKSDKDMPLAAWIFRIATNEALRLCGRRRHRPVSLEAATAAEAHAVMAEEYIDYSDLESVKLQNAILSLPPKQRLAFNLRYYDEFDYPAIAQITGSSLSAVKANYHAAKEKIIRFMKSHD